MSSVAGYPPGHILFGWHEVYLHTSQSCSASIISFVMAELLAADLSNVQFRNDSSPVGTESLGVGSEV
jgi:hypothetical protein